MTNTKTRLIAAYRAIGPDTVDRLMSIGDLPAQRREDHFAHLARSADGTFGVPRKTDIEKYGQAAYVYAALHTHWREISHWTGKRDWITQSAKAAALADVPLDELSDRELGCRVYTAITESDRIPGEIIEDFHRRRGQTYIETAQEIGLTVQAAGYSSGLNSQRKEGTTGQGVLALWCVMRDTLDFSGE